MKNGSVSKWRGNLKDKKIGKAVDKEKWAKKGVGIGRKWVKEGRHNQNNCDDKRWESSRQVPNDRLREKIEWNIHASAPEWKWYAVQLSVKFKSTCLVALTNRRTSNSNPILLILFVSFSKTLQIPSLLPPFLSFFFFSFFIYNKQRGYLTASARLSNAHQQMFAVGKSLVCYGFIESHQTFCFFVSTTVRFQRSPVVPW